jgi:hypothetical protein
MSEATGTTNFPVPAGHVVNDQASVMTLVVLLTHMNRSPMVVAGWLAAMAAGEPSRDAAAAAVIPPIAASERLLRL